MSYTGEPPLQRAQLPSRRATDVVAFLHEKRLWTATASRFPDGRTAEIFLDVPKESPLADAARESASYWCSNMAAPSRLSFMRSTSATGRPSARRSGCPAIARRFDVL